MARCGPCKKNIKLDLMGESSLKSHAKGAAHRHAARALANGKLTYLLPYCNHVSEFY